MRELRSEVDSPDRPTEVDSTGLTLECCGRGYIRSVHYARTHMIDLIRIIVRTHLMNVCTCSNVIQVHVL